MNDGGAPARGPGAGTVVRVALVGLGWAGRTLWRPRLDAHPAYRVTALVEPDPGVRAAAGGDVPVLADADDVDPASVDLAVVAVPNHLHAPVAARILRRGIAV
ncbi:Gfo/Idh/MocA family oxidoreductase, partial [Uniformispora flossi]|uniref:Gfo/Idh/MocA family oxidoreductase n=1 Tax=Uniformispora flossi TaxID=3390723 RepID=UPI003CFF6667